MANDDHLFNSHDQITIHPPILKGQTSKVLFTTPKQIDQSDSLVNSLQMTINAAFKEQSSRTKILDSNVRMVKGSIFEEQLGNDPTTFCIIVLQPDQSFVAGTVAARRFSTSSLPIDRSSLIPKGEKLNTRAIFTRTDIPQHYSNSIFWELKILAVHPLMQGQRLAKWLMDTAESEIKRRTLKTHPKANEVIILLTTVEQHAAPLYTKRGYSIDGKQEYPPGTVESENGFTVIHMYKRFDLP